MHNIILLSFGPQTRLEAQRPFSVVRDISHSFWCLGSNYFCYCSCTPLLFHLSVWKKPSEMVRRLLADLCFFHEGTEPTTQVQLWGFSLISNLFLFFNFIFHQSLVAMTKLFENQKWMWQKLSFQLFFSDPAQFSFFAQVMSIFFGVHSH